MPPIVEALLWAALAAIIVGFAFSLTIGYGGVAGIVTFLLVLLMLAGSGKVRRSDRV